MVTDAVACRLAAAASHPASQRADSLSATRRLRRAETCSSRRVQIAASTTPITASLSTSTAITG